MPVFIANNALTINGGPYTTLAQIMTEFAAAGGVFTTSLNAGKTTYYMPNYGFTLNASATAVSWNPEVEELVFGRTLVDTTWALIMNPGSSLTIGFEYVQNGRTLRTKGFGLRMERPQTLSTTAARGSVVGNLTVYGDIQIGQTFNLTGTMRVYGDIYSVAPTGTSDASIRQSSPGNLIHEGDMVSIRGGKPVRLWVGTAGGLPAVTRSLSSKFENVVIQAQSGGANAGLLTYKGVRNATNSYLTLLERSANLANWQAAQIQPIRFLNMDVGTGYAAGFGYGVSWSVQEVSFSVIDAETSAALTFKSAVVGKNNNALNPWQDGGGSSAIQAGLDFTSPAYLMHLFNGTETKEVLLGVLSTSQSRSESHFGFSKTGVKGQDVFPVCAVAYGYAGTSADVSLPSESVRTVPLGLFKSTQVTQRSASVVAAYAEANSVSKVTDLAHLWLYSNFDGTSIKPSVTRTVDAADFGDKVVVIDKLAASVYAESGNTVTFRADIFAGNIVTTATVNFMNGASIDGIYEDAGGSSVTIEIMDMPHKSATCLWDGVTGQTIHYAYNTTGQSATYKVQFPPGSAGRQVRFARELYGSVREEQLMVLSEGITRIILFDLPDVGIEQPSQATVEGYTILSALGKEYDRVAVFRLSEAGIKLGQIVTQAGADLNHGAYNIMLDANAPAPLAVSTETNTITVRAGKLSPSARLQTFSTTGAASFANGSYSAVVYTSSAGRSGILTISLPASSSALVTAPDGTTSYTAITGLVQTIYIDPGVVGTYTVKVGKRGFKPATQSVTITGGGNFSLAFALTADSQDTLTNPVTATNSQSLYDAICVYRISEAGMAFDFSGVVKSFGAIDVGSINLVQSSAANAVIEFEPGVLTFKSATLESDTFRSSGVFAQTGTPLLDNSVRIRASNLDSELVFNVDSIKAFPTEADRDNNTNAGDTLSGGIYRYKYGQAYSGVSFGGTLHFRSSFAGSIFLQYKALEQGETAYTLDVLSLAQANTSQISDIRALVLQRPTLTQIEASGGKLDKAMKAAQAAEDQTV